MALRCVPQVTANAVPKPQAKSCRFPSHGRTGAHRHHWAVLGGCSPLSWDVPDSHCCFLLVSAMLSSPPAPLLLPGSPAWPPCHGRAHPGSAGAPPARLGLVQVCFPQRVFAPRSEGAVVRRGSAQSRCLEELQTLRPELRGLWKLVRCRRACLSLLSTCLCIFLLKSVVRFHLLFVNLKNWRKWFGR